MVVGTEGEKSKGKGWIIEWRCKIYSVTSWARVRGQRRCVKRDKKIFKKNKLNQVTYQIERK